MYSILYFYCSQKTLKTRILPLSQSLIFRPLTASKQMDYFTAKTFTIPALKGISSTNIEEHLKLYAGYVKFANYTQNKIAELMKNATANAYEIGELNRRFSFEFNGMRNHEIYFAQFEVGAKVASAESTLHAAIATEFGSWENFVIRFKTVAMTRGIGWTMLSKDSVSGKLLIHWLDEQHLGQLQNAQPILALDMWEHSYVADYQPSGKKQYVEDFFENLNWEVVEKRF